MLPFGSEARTATRLPGVGEDAELESRLAERLRKHTGGDPSPQALEAALTRVNRSLGAATLPVGAYREVLQALGTPSPPASTPMLLARLAAIPAQSLRSRLKGEAEAQVESLLDRHLGPSRTEVALRVVQLLMAAPVLLKVYYRLRLVVPGESVEVSRYTDKSAAPPDVVAVDELCALGRAVLVAGGTLLEEDSSTPEPAPVPEPAPDVDAPEPEVEAPVIDATAQPPETAAEVSPRLSVTRRRRAVSPGYLVQLVHAGTDRGQKIIPVPGAEDAFRKMMEVSRLHLGRPLRIALRHFEERGGGVYRVSSLEGAELLRRVAQDGAAELRVFGSGEVYLVTRVGETGTTPSVLPPASEAEAPTPAPEAEPAAIFPIPPGLDAPAIAPFRVGLEEEEQEAQVLELLPREEDFVVTPTPKPSPATQKHPLWERGVVAAIVAVAFMPYLLWLLLVWR